jgi:hypothetical protein
MVTRIKERKLPSNELLVTSVTKELKSICQGFWNDSNVRSCTSLWTPHGKSLIHSSEETSAALQSKKKSAVTALIMVIDFAPIPIIWQ